MSYDFGKPIGQWTDTELLDYLQEDTTMRPIAPHDAQFGRVWITLGVGHGTLRDRLRTAIVSDMQRTLTQVTNKLKGH